MSDVFSQPKELRKTNSGLALFGDLTGMMFLNDLGWFIGIFLKGFWHCLGMRTVLGITGQFLEQHPQSGRTILLELSVVSFGYIKTDDKN